MDRIQSVVLIDGAMRRRAAISRKLRNGGKHVEPFESISDLTLVWPHSGLVLAHDEGGTIGALVAQMGSTGTWLPVIAYAESPSPDRVARAILAGAIGYIAWPFEDAELAEALSGSAERHAEAMRQGQSFLDAARNWFEPGALPRAAMPLVVAVGAAAGRCGIDRQTAVAAFLHALVSNQLQAAIRLSVTGQQGAARILALLEPEIAAAARRASTSTLDDLGTIAFAAEIASLNHETLQPRLFLS